MFGIDSLDFVDPPKPIPRPRLRRVLAFSLAAIALVAAILYVIAMPAIDPAADHSALVVFLVAIAVNVLISLGLGYLAYRSARNRMNL